MQTLDVCKRESGKIWHRKPTPTDDGLLVEVTHRVSSSLSNVRIVRFLHASFSAKDDRFVAADHQGNVYLFDLHRNRFSLVKKTGTSCTALAFSLRRNNEVLVALADCSLRCYDIDEHHLVAEMRGHVSPVHAISVHTSGRHALTSSGDAAQLWDLDSFQRRRKLNVKENVGIVKVFFLPFSNTIVTCFKDDSLFAWESDTLKCKYQLHTPEQTSAANFRAFATTRDGRLLVGGGKSRFLHVWSLETHRTLRLIQLPAKVLSVKQLEFLPDSFDAGANQVLGVLSQDGIMRFINIESCKLLFDVGRLDDHINSVAVSATGRHLVAIMDSGNLNVYNLATLYSQLNQPPPPLVKVLKENKMAANTSRDPKKRTKRPTKKRKPAESDDMQNEPLDEMPEGLRMSRLRSILREFGEYPAKYRMFIWRCVLRLPENHSAYGALVDKGIYPAYEKLHERFPIKSRKLLRVLQRVLSAIAYWSPIFGETDYLPMLAFPFVKLFQNNQLVCFEIIATILSNWGCHWFEFFPNPPINVLALIENLLAYHDRSLLQHFVRHGVTSQIYAWPLLESLFSEVLTRDEWLRLFDNIFSNRPIMLLYVVVAYCTCNRRPLLQCTDIDDFKYFFHHRNAVDVNNVIKEAYRLSETTGEDFNPEVMQGALVPLTKGQYPIFYKYPKFIVDYQVHERERIRQEEMEYLQQRTAALQLEEESGQRQAEEQAWYRQRELLLHTEQQRKKLIAEEERKLISQRSRLAAMMRELKLKELQAMDATRRKFLQHQQMKREAEIANLDDQIRRKAELREIETKAAVDEVEIRNMQLKVQNSLYTQELRRGGIPPLMGDAGRERREAEERARLDRSTRQTKREQHIRQVLQQSLVESENRLAEQQVTESSVGRAEGHVPAPHGGAHSQQAEEDKTAKLAALEAENRRLEQTVEQMMGTLEQYRKSNAAMDRQVDSEKQKTDSSDVAQHGNELSSHENDWALDKPTVQRNGWAPEEPTVQRNGWTTQEPTVQTNGWTTEEPTVQRNGWAPEEPTVQRNGWTAEQPSVQRDVPLTTEPLPFQDAWASGEPMPYTWSSAPAGAACQADKHPYAPTDGAAGDGAPGYMGYNRFEEPTKHGVNDDEADYKIILTTERGEACGSPCGAVLGSSPNGKCLNSSSEAESTPKLSLDRGRQTFEERERNLMMEVRKLRQTLAQRNNRPAPRYNLDDI